MKYTLQSHGPSQSRTSRALDLAVTQGAARTGRAATSTGGNGPLLSACMIVKNEQDTLPDCFASLHQLVDEVVVYDTGSTDGTVAICERAGARVIAGYWDDDFARARNASLRECRGEWALWIDADERFVCPNIPQLRAVLATATTTDALAVEIFNLGDDPGDVNVNVHRALRIFRRSRCRWYGSIHEQIDLDQGLDGTVQVVPLKGAHLDHVGYRNDMVVGRDKLVRNLRLAEAALGRDTGMRGQEGVAELNMGRALAALGRCEEAQAYLDRAVAIAAPGATLRACLMFGAQNALQAGQSEKSLELAKRLADQSSTTDLASYLQGMALRRLGRNIEAAAMYDRVTELANEDGFAFPMSLLRAEKAGTYWDIGRVTEAADELVALVEDAPEVSNLSAALKVLAASGRAPEDLLAVLPESRLERLAAALILVPPVVADPMAEALFRRFGPRPQILAAAIRFAPYAATDRALEWSARLRAIGMTEPCPLVAQAGLEVLEVGARIRAALTAHAAFGDPRGEPLALALAPGLHLAQIEAVVAEVALLDPPLVERFMAAASAPGAPGAGPIGSPEEREARVSAARLKLRAPDLKETAPEERANPGHAVLVPQVATSGADR